MIPNSIKEILKRDTEKSKVTEFENDEGGSYPYVILPLESRASPEYFEAVVEGLKYMMEDEIERANVVLGIEAKAFVVTPLLAKELGLDWVAIRKRDYRMEQLVIEQNKAYKGATKLYCVGLEKGDKPLIVEDMISSGGTLTATLEVLKKKNFEVAGIGSVYERGDGIKRIKEAGYNAKGLMRLEIKNGKPHVPRFYGD